MARTAEGAALTQAHRRQQVQIRAGALRDLTTLWRAVDPADLSRTIEPFARAASVMLRERNRESATLAGRYFRRFRDAEGVAGSAFSVFTPDPPPRDVVLAAVRGAALSGIINARRRGISVPAAARNGFVKASGSATSLVLRGSRETLLGATASDRASTGRWQRITDPDACAFCAMLASRGAVFVPGGGVSTSSDITFSAHGNCACQAEPAYEGTELPAASRRFREQWDEVTEGKSGKDALNAFRQAREGRTPPSEPDTGE